MSENREHVFPQHRDKNNLRGGIRWCTTWLVRNEGRPSVRTAAIHNRLQAYRLLLNEGKDE